MMLTIAEQLSLLKQKLDNIKLIKDDIKISLNITDDIPFSNYSAIIESITTELSSELGYINETGAFQPISFTDKSSANCGQPETVDFYYMFNTPSENTIDSGTTNYTIDNLIAIEFSDSLIGQLVIKVGNIHFCSGITIDFSKVTANTKNVLAGKYFYDNTGKLVSGQLIMQDKQFDINLALDEINTELLTIYGTNITVDNVKEINDINIELNNINTEITTILGE